MINGELDHFLRSETDSEKWHRAHPGELSEVYRGLESSDLGGTRVYMFDFTNDMSPEGIIVFKETRYTELHPHRHKYLELNYVYSGSCTFDINGARGVLREGDICIMEPDVVHAAEPKGSDDIVLNIALTDSYYQTDILANIDVQETVSSFLLDCLDQTRRRDHFLVFRSGGNALLDMTINAIAYQYLFDHRTAGYYSRVQQYVKLLFMHLAALVYDSDWSEYPNQGRNKSVLEILRYINRNFAHCRLQSVADEFNYSYSYLSTMLRRETGHTFGELKLEQQLLAARDLLLHSSLPIAEICERTGFSNQSFFFRRFSAVYGASPGQYRKDHAGRP
jgi:AraC-like DNA-binding protein/mannose-6-phosphate isomerase-like protein (cupin superfamily)